jgi:hypothetical protein
MGTKSTRIGEEF